MMNKFCPKCGKTISKGSFCNECNPETIDFKQINVKLCPSGRYFVQGKWFMFKDLREASLKLVKQFVKQDVELIKGLEGNEEWLEKPGLEKTLDFEVEYKDKLFKIPVNVGITLSPAVAKVGSKYFEGILQLRNARQDVKEYIAQYTAKHEVYINKVVDLGKDVDYFFVRKKQLQPLALKLMRNFGAVIDSNAQLFSRNRQTSKDIFRVNTLVTLPNFAIGDVVEFEDAPILIKETNKIITGINLATGKKATFRSEQANSSKLLLKLKSKITIIRPEVQIIDPKTYESMVVKNPLGLEFKVEQNVLFVNYKGNAYVLK
jgi:NMD protein affecting ribosome stability and mRNA decay